MVTAKEVEMKQISETRKSGSKQMVRNSCRATRKHYSAEEKTRIVLDALRGEDSIAELCRREGIAERLYYSGSKAFLEAGKKRLSGDTARQASSGEVQALRHEMHDLKEALGEQVLENWLVERSHDPVWRTLDKLGIPCTTFYRWPDRGVGPG